MKLIRIARLPLDAKHFKHGGELFEVTIVPGRKKAVWTLYKRFRGQVEYRILADTKNDIPVAIQRLAS